MADKFTHMSSYPVKLHDNGDDTYSLKVSIEGGAITTLSSGTLTELLHVTTVSNIDTVSKVLSIDTLSTIESIQTVNSLVTVTEISNVSSIDTIDVINSVQTINAIVTITEISNVSSVDTIDVINSIITITEITNISNLAQGIVTVTQNTHDSLNCNANIQVANADVSTSNAMPVNTKKAIDSSIGVYGGAYITTTATTTPSTGHTFFAIQAIEDVVISSVTGNIDVSSIAFDAGITIYGDWTAIKLTSGKVLAYQRVT